MNIKSNKKIFIILATFLFTILSFLLVNKYYTVQPYSLSGGKRLILIKTLLICISLILGYLTAKAFSELKEAISFLKISAGNTRLIRSLSRNDFRNKFASSYLGIAWGFIHPLITVAVYWFVFQVGLRQTGVQSSMGGETPFILWFLCGIIPWFLFSEAFPTMSNVFLEYNYLVKKVVFKIEILPMVKLISALFVHGFFILFIFIVMAIYGRYPDTYTIQFIYYSFSLVCLVYSISIFTSAVLLFFRDLSQIVSIILSVGFWFTPIGWPLSRLPESVAVLFKLNPVYYIVTGYRDAFIDKIYFWQRPYETLYFWGFIFVVFCLSVKLFNKLKPHFSDVL